jgi:uncharacterized membrane protein
MTSIRANPLGLFFGVCFATVAAAGVACNDDDSADHGDHGDHDHEEVGHATGAECDSSLTYDSFGQDFMEKYCLRCHSETVPKAQRAGAPEDHNFDTLEDIRFLRAHIDGLAGKGPDATNTDMPRDNPKPTDAEREKLSKWLACGAK